MSAQEMVFRDEKSIRFIGHIYFSDTATRSGNCGVHGHLVYVAVLCNLLAQPAIEEPVMIVTLPT